MKIYRIIIVLCVIISYTNCTNQKEPIVLEKFDNGNLKKLKLYTDQNDILSHRIIEFERNGDTSKIMNYYGL